MLNTNKIKKRLQAAIRAWQDADKPIEVPQTEEQIAKEVDQFKKQYSKGLELEKAKRDCWRKLKQEEINEMIETGLLSLDSLYKACTELPNAGYKGGSVRYKDKWVDAKNIQKAYRNPKFSDKLVVMDAKGNAESVIENNSNQGAIAGASDIISPQIMGYGMLSQLQSQVWVRKCLNLKAKSQYGKGVVLNGDGTEKTDRDIEKIYKAIDRLKVKRTMITALKRAYLFGGVSIVPKIRGVSDEGLKKEIKFTSAHIPKGSLQGFNVVSPYFCTPMIPNTTDATGEFYYDPEHWFLINKLIHASRLINLDVDKPDEYQSPLYYYRGISLVQSIFKYIFQLILTSNSTCNSLLQNSLWILETSKDYQSNKKLQQDVARIAKERNNAMIIPVAMGDKFSVLQIDIGANAEIAKLFQEILATLMDCPHTMFLGVSAKGLTTSGMQEMKNWHDQVATDRVDNGYDEAWVEIINYIQLSELGYINDSITIQNVELDESYERARLDSSLVFTQIQEILFNMGIFDGERILHAISQCAYHPMNKIVQSQQNSPMNSPPDTDEHDIPDEKLNTSKANDAIFQELFDSKNVQELKQRMKTLYLNRKW